MKEIPNSFVMMVKVEYLSALAASSGPQSGVLYW
jgi:hypothetical protein